jgi:excisionase family DNA binding protein
MSDRLTLADIHPDALYTPEQAAQALGVCLDTVYRLGRTQQMPASRVGPRGGRTKFVGRVILQYAQPKAA